MGLGVVGWGCDLAPAAANGSGAVRVLLLDQLISRHGVAYARIRVGLGHLELLVGGLALDTVLHVQIYGACWQAEMRMCMCVCMAMCMCMCMRMCMRVCMGMCRALALWPLHVCTLMTLLCHIGLQQLLHAHTGCSLSHLWLQPQSHKDAALFTYGQSLNHLGWQP